MKKFFGGGKKNRSDSNSSLTSKDITVGITQHQPKQMIETLDQVQLLEQVGQGSYGVVYKAIDLKASLVIALKKTSISPSDDMEKIKQEIHILRFCVHPNIIGFRGSFLRNKNTEFWIAMEFCKHTYIHTCMHIHTCTTHTYILKHT